MLNTEPVIKAADGFVRVMVKVPEGYLLLKPLDTSRPAIFVIDHNGSRVTSISLEKALEGMDCEVVSGMRVVGITNAAVKHRFPATLELEDAERVSRSQDDRGAHEAAPR